MAHKVNTKDNSIELALNKTYKTLIPLEMGRHDLQENVIFKVTHLGYEWDNPTRLKIISGNLRNNVHSSFFHNSTKNYNGSQAFLPLEKLKEKLGIDTDIIVHFDPFNNYNNLPVVKVKNK